MRWALQWLRIVLAGVAFVGFGLGAPLVGFALVFFWISGGTPIERRRRCQRVVGGSFRFFHAYMNAAGLIRYQPNLVLPALGEPRIIIANHPTLVDVTAIVAAHPETTVLVKAAIFDNPLFYLIMRFCGHIRVSRDAAQGATDAILEATRRLDEGSDVLLFPEGTRSPTLAPAPFRAGAFALAVHAERPLSLVAIFCSRPVLKRGTPWYLIPPQTVSLTLENLGTIRPNPDESIPQLKARVERMFASSLPSSP